MPKMDFKVKRQLFEFVKIQLLRGKMKNDVGDWSTMTQKMLLGLLVISKKKFKSFFSKK